MNNQRPPTTIRMACPNDFLRIAQIESAVWGETGATYEMITSRSNVFPAGSMVAVDGSGAIFGYVVVQLVDAFTQDSWSQQTDDGKILQTHRSLGKKVYGVNMSVLQHYAEAKTGSLFLDHIYQTLVVNGPAETFSLGSRMPGFQKWLQKNPGDIQAQAETYWQLKHRGDKFRDPEIEYYRSCGFMPQKLIPDYFPDESSHDFGVLMTHL